MIITRTPFRVSFFGGGTDYPAWYREHAGAVLAGSIDQYCYISARWLPNYLDARYRIVYSRIERCQDVRAIEHPSVRACLRHLGIRDGVEIVHNADLPARSGLGSSSAFTVGLLHALRALLGEPVDSRALAAEAIDVEQNVIGEHVGSQDQVATAVGGLNRIGFFASTSREFAVRPLHIGAEALASLEARCLLIWTGLSRLSSDVAGHQVRSIPSKSVELATMHSFVDIAAAMLERGAIDDFARLLHENWLLKRSLTSHISTPLIDEIYAAARAAGALGGKLLGAGGGGFLLLMAPPERREGVLAALPGYRHAPLKFEHQGSQIIFDSHEQAASRSGARQAVA